MVLDAAAVRVMGTAKTDDERARQVDMVLKDLDERAKDLEIIPLRDPDVRFVYDRALQNVDRAKLLALQAYVRENLDTYVRQISFKYLDVPGYLRDKARWVAKLGLGRSKPLRILDLGVGGGHFTFGAKSCGHTVVGLDLQDDLYGRLLALYEIPRIIHRIEPMRPLPIEGPFDLVIALQTTFNRLAKPTGPDPADHFWTTEDWAFFLSDLSKHLRYPARIFFHLNRQPVHGTDYAEVDRLLGLFERNSALLDRGGHTVLFELDGPLALKN